MNKFIFALVLSVCTTLAWAQNVRLVVTDANQQPIENVTASHHNTVISSSNLKGELTLNCELKTYTLFKEGYEVRTIELSNCAGPMEITLTRTTSIEGVEIYETRIDRRIDLPSNEVSTVIDRELLQQQTGLFLNESINRVSGVRFENRTVSGGQRITIRGYGNTERFNGYGYRAYLNGIPITDAEGVTLLDEIDPSMLQNITVLKGPSSTRFGNGIAGAVLMESYRPQRLGSRLSQELTVGSFGLLRSNTRFETRSNRGSFVVNYGWQSWDSYRVHNASNRQFLSFNGDIQLRDKEQVQFYFGYHHTDELLAGQLDSSEFFGRENVAETRYVDNNASVAFEGFRSALGYVNERSALTYRANVFASSHQHAQAFAVGLNENQRLSFGGRATLGWSSSDDRWNLDLGTEWQSNRNQLISYGYTNALLTGLRSNLQFSASNLMGFGEVSYRPFEKLTLTAGISATSVGYSIEDRLSYDTTHLDGSGTYDFGWQPSPRFLVQYALSRGNRISASVSRGFSAPTAANVVIPEIGAVNSDLQNETGTQYELNYVGRALNQKLSYQAAIYLLDIDQKLTSEAITDEQGSVLYTRAFNSGAQSNLGVEIDFTYQILQNSEGWFTDIDVMANYSYSHHRYVDFYSNVNAEVNRDNYSGNPVSGVPPHMANLVLSADTKIGIYANAGYQYIDEMPINLENTAYAPAFGLLNAKVGFRHSFDKFNIDLFIGGQNLTGALHYNMVILNQAPRFGNAPRVFLPGSYEAIFFGGIKLNYQL